MECLILEARVMSLHAIQIFSGQKKNNWTTAETSNLGWVYMHVLSLFCQYFPVKSFVQSPFVFIYKTIQEIKNGSEDSEISSTWRKDPYFA